MIVKGSVVLQAGIRSEFIQGYQAGPTMVPKFATIIPSNKSQETYAWLGEVAAVREWLGEREIKGFTDTSFIIKNKKWEWTLGVEREEIEDDQTGGILIRARDGGERARQHPDDLLFSSLVANPTCYDGVALFSASHPARTPDGSVQSNTLTGTGTTVAQLTADAASAIAALRKFKDERGKPFWPSIDPNKLIAMCPPDLEVNLKTVFGATIISNTTNLLQGAVGDVVVNPWLTDVNDWFLVYTGGILKPMIFQDREPITMDDHGIDTDTGFLKDLYLFGTRARYNVGPGLWQTIVRITN